MNKFIYILIFPIFLSSCSYLLTDHKNDYLKEKQEKSLDIPEGLTTRPIIDYYPINTLNQTCSDYVYH